VVFKCSFVYRCVDAAMLKQGLSALSMTRGQRIIVD
jgi:hypothetical protein